MSGETILQRVQLHPAQLRFTTRTTYYNNLFLLRTLISINGQLAEIGCSVAAGTGKLTLNCRYPSVSIAMDSISAELTPILKKNGVYEVTNFWCDGEVPLFGIAFSSQYGLKKLLRCTEKMQAELASTLSRLFTEKHRADTVQAVGEPTTSHECIQVTVGTGATGKSIKPSESQAPILLVIAHSEVFQITPDPVKAQAKLVKVTLENYMTCMTLWKESEVFDFMSLFRLNRVDPGKLLPQGTVTLKDLLSELCEVVDWFHLGVNLEIPDYELMKIKYDCRDTDECKMHMLMKCMKLKELTWSDIVAALVGIKMGSLARNIALKYGAVVPPPKLLPSAMEKEEGSVTQLKLTERVAQLQKALETNDKELERKQQLLENAEKEKTATKHRVARIHQMVITVHNKTTGLLKEKNELEKQLELKQQELEFLHTIKRKDEEKLQLILDNKRIEIKWLQDHLQEVEGELQSEKKCAHELRVELSLVDKELEGKSSQVRELEKAMCELRLDYKNERKRVDMLLMQLTAATTSKEQYTKEIEHQVSALKEESKIKAQEVEAYKQVVIQKNEEIDQLLAQLQQLEEEGQVMQEERTLQHSVQQLQFEQQVHQLTVDSSKLRMKLAQVEDEKADAVRQLEFAQNTKEFQDSCVTDSISKLEKSAPKPAAGTPNPAAGTPVHSQRLQKGDEVVGKYDYTGSASHDLPFKREDKLVIIRTSKDPNWYKARRYDGLEGMIPYNYVVKARKPVNIQYMPWYHGTTSYKEAENRLQPFHNGKFLVHDSKNFPGDYTLCISYEDKAERYRVRRDDRGWVTADDEEYFENLVELVKHYQVDADGLCCQLKFSVDHPDGVFEHTVSHEDFRMGGWTIQSRHLTKKSLIGSGEFREVWLGEYQGKKVAIRSMTGVGEGDPNSEASREFWTEAAIMTTLKHPNLVALIGVVVDPPPYIITEYMAKGSLQDYLRSSGRAVISKHNQLSFAKDICQGMVYLESRSFVHRDLATRNVELSEERLSEERKAKISGFTLTIEVPSRCDTRARLPVKWTAPEALREKKFSNKSDVWSFGILLWEIYSYGRNPYPGKSVDEVAGNVGKGSYRMAPPDGCPDAIYQLMINCWEKDPTIRPNFSHIKKMLDSIPY